MRVDLVTIFPRLFESPLQEGLIRRARERGALEVRVYDLRQFAPDRHRTTDDYPYGGGAGMVMKVEPVARAIAHLRQEDPGAWVILLTPQGRRLEQSWARELATRGHLVFVCGRYEGVDERVRALVDEELSIGDYVLSGGELAALVVIEVLARLLPGVVGDARSLEEESFAEGLLEYPQYTRPRVFQGMEVPEVLLSGDHERIRRWRRRESLRRTLERRPDLLEGARLSEEDRRILEELRDEQRRGDRGAGPPSG